MMPIKSILKGLAPPVLFEQYQRLTKKYGYMGRYQTWEQAEDLVQYYTAQGIAAKNYNIEVEKALEDGVNIIIFANGTSGNMHFRSLVYCANIAPLALPHLGIKENITENSRNMKDYYNRVLFVAARANAK